MTHFRVQKGSVGAMGGFLYDFLVEFIAAFFGFLFAILLDRLNAKREDRKRIRSIVQSIQNELQDIDASIQEYLQQRVVLRHRIAIPTWDALQYAGGVMDLMDKPYYDDLLSAYSAIKLYNEERSAMEPEDAYRTLSRITQLSEAVLHAIEEEVK